MTEDRMAGGTVPGSAPAEGVVAGGHPVTCDAAAEIIAAGGNAFDGVAGAFWAACVAEPLLASPGGGGFLLARPTDGQRRIFDFFAQTPRKKQPHDEVDFREALVDFGTARQPFGIGLGAVATPGAVAGVFQFHRELGRMPMREVMEPALAAARAGVRVNGMQAFVAKVLRPIIEATPEAKALFSPEPADAPRAGWSQTGGGPSGSTTGPSGSSTGPTGSSTGPAGSSTGPAGQRSGDAAGNDGGPMREGDTLRLPELANFLEALGIEGAELFYRGEVAERVDAASREGRGHVRRADFERYRVVDRTPLEVSCRGYRIWTNAPPASGGLLVAFGLQLLAGDRPPPNPSGPANAERLADVLRAMQEARIAEGLAKGVDGAVARRLLSAEMVSLYRDRVAGHPPSGRGTTHVSIIDGEGNAAALSVSNGEGCGWIVPGTGMMLNNMLGEGDLQPGGFGRWPPDTRLTSMMAPTLLEDPRTGRLIVLGSGGSNRIRSAILQVLSGIIDHDLPLHAAVTRPRLHVERDRLEIEGGFEQETLAALVRRWGNHCIWPERNLFFGGVHAAEARPDGFGGVGDPRRDGVAMVLPGRASSGGMG